MSSNGISVMSLKPKKASQDTISLSICSKQDETVVQKTKSKQPSIVQSPHKDLLDDFHQNINLK
jgi:hypothetical protein